MNKIFSKPTAAKILFILIVGGSVTLPLIGMAQSSGGNTVVGIAANPYTAPSIWPTGYWGKGGLISCTGDYLANAPAGTTPCTSLCDLINTFVNIVYFLMSIAIFIITPIIFVWGGIMIMISGASPEMLGTGKKILTGAVIGLVIVLCSYLLISTVLKVLSVTAIGGFGGATCTPD